MMQKESQLGIADRKRNDKKPANQIEFMNYTAEHANPLFFN
jgi:hypothetical protein